MRLLVSVRNAAEAAEAAAGGADIIDAKEPLNGPLGVVPADVLASIASAVSGVPLSAAIGDASDRDLIGRAAAARRSGAAFVKVGFARTARTEMDEHVRAVIAAAGGVSVVLVAYADYRHADAPSPDVVIALAERTNAAGVLLDTCDKRGAGLTSLLPRVALAAFVRRARSGPRLVALAGRLTLDDLGPVRDAGADIAGVRGAACGGDRCGLVAAGHVRALRRRIAQTAAFARPAI